MKKRLKGILAFAFLGGIMLTSTIAIAIPGIDPTNPELELTGTPADNYPPEERAQFCGSGIARSTDYIQEFSIPTQCTNPLAITTDYYGNVWFAQTNTGKVAKFDPISESFTEYDNPFWPLGGRSMMWGMDYAPDGSVWFTDEAFDSVWKFSTLDETYERLAYTGVKNPLPQRLLVHGSQIIVNDFVGNKLTFLDPTESSAVANYIDIPSPVNGSVTSDFAIDADDNVWYTNWLFQSEGFLVKLDQSKYFDSIVNADEEQQQQLLASSDFVETWSLPAEMIAPNGAVTTDDGTVWLSDTASSFFFNFDPMTEQFTQYVTADPILDTYGNQTGISQSPISRPYWIDVDEQGRLIFNPHAANNISVMDPKSQSLVEYQIPSKNPYWGDCSGIDTVLENCGLAQTFDFTIHGEKIWFTEWVENNIGVVDTSVPLPMEIQLESDAVPLDPGGSKHFNFIIYPQSQKDLMDVSLILSTTRDFLNIELDHDTPHEFQLDSGAPRTVHATISASEDATPGTYKVLLGAQSSDIAVSKFITVTIT